MEIAAILTKSTKNKRKLRRESLPLPSTKIQKQSRTKDSVNVDVRANTRKKGDISTVWNAINCFISLAYESPQMPPKSQIVKFGVQNASSEKTMFSTK